MTRTDRRTETGRTLQATRALHATRPGRYFPPGATPDERGVNFSIVCEEADTVELRLYEHADSAEPRQVIVLSPEVHRTFHFWHVYVEDLQPGAHYTWRIARRGQSLDTAPELFDPWARAASDARWDRKATIAGHAGSHSLRAIVTTPCNPPLQALPATAASGDVVIYEVHVGGFTRHPTAGVQHPGTFAGLIEKVPYLKALGVTHVELLPVMAFDEQSIPAAAVARGLKNYWGYNTYGFYAPHPGYCIDPARAPQEFRDCVDALHDAGIGVLLDVVFNHTAEGGSDGPTINFKAIADDVFYHHEAGDPRRYRDYTGVGNTVNCNHPVVTNFIVRCLEYWTTELGVDGYRFDLASVFSRDENGTPLEDPALTWSIELSHALAGRPIIAEAWDAVGLYQVGSFPGMRWAEWNGRYRDVVRRFVRGDPELVGELATRLAGSSDMYAGRSPLHSVNFIACHDGYTLYDLVSYDRKHNEANGEGNRDGNSDNLSWNCGAEGPTDDVAIAALRRRQAKNFMAIVFLSQGVPMILSGDEVLRSQSGNNNAYCQDNELSWFDWRLTETNRDMLRFTRELIALRRRHPSLRRRRFLTGQTAPGAALPDIAWHGERLNEPPWHDGSAKWLAFTLAGAASDEAALHVMLNMSHEPRRMAVPAIGGREWRRAIDTALPSPDDIAPREQQHVSVSGQYVVEPRSVVVLETR